MSHLAWAIHRLVRVAGMVFIPAALGTTALTQDQTAGIRGPNVAYAGAYSFSDELGGFHLISAGGTGTRDDPITVTQELLSASPVTMVIRAVAPVRPFDHSGLFASGFMHMRIVVINNSGLPWVEFEFELQEHLGQPSLFGDGLSFDQRKSDSPNIHSDSFLTYDRDFEPYDRLLYQDGKVDPLETASFSFFVTDFTPRWTFYLVENPRIPSS
jgi:hypothetical protein